MSREIIVIPSEDRILSDQLQQTEFSRVISERAKMIDAGNEIFCIPKHTNAIEIAIQELQENKCPIVIIRTREIHKDKMIVEHWSPNELERAHLLGIKS